MDRTTPGLSLWGMAFSLLLPFASHASEIATNIQYTFSETADFSAGIDKAITLDAAKIDARLLNSRLGTFSSGDLVFTLNANHSVSINDPGVATFPSEARNLIQVNGAASASGALLPEAESLNIGATWFCASTSLQCNSNQAFSTLRTSTQSLSLPADPATLLTPIRLQSGISSVTPLGDSTLNYGKLHLNGSLQLNALFTAKTTSQYVSDALQATASSSGSQRWGAAATDIQALRNGSWTDVAVASNLQASKTPSLEAAHRLLAIARDSATILNSGSTTGASFNSDFTLTKQLWNVAATAEPALGRDVAGSSSVSFDTTDLAAEIAVLRMVLDGADDTSFVAGVAHALNNPLNTGSAPVLSFDGSLIGLAGATMSVFYLGDSSGRVEVELGAADRYAFWRTAYSFDSIAFLQGAQQGVTVIGGNSGGTQIGLGEYGYVGEIYNDELFYLSGNQAAARLQLNNFYDNKLLVVASWAVTAVPEPSVYCLLLFGLVLVGRMRSGASERSAEYMFHQ
ncbi:PEP-CTERM sorting domain-containing protein [Methylophilus luteus]|uniref:PEP-CTERM sorting domain-containing protein n=1 Tax=Methylophilus luteus TaxID=640108 RepID=A0ABW3F8Z1_9PROT